MVITKCYVYGQHSMLAYVDPELFKELLKKKCFSIVSRKS